MSCGRKPSDADLSSQPTTTRLENNIENKALYRIGKLFFDGLTGKLMLPLLRPDCRNKSLSVARIMQRVVEYLHKHWPNTIIELHGDSHFASHNLMDWPHDK